MYEGMKGDGVTIPLGFEEEEVVDLSDIGVWRHSIPPDAQRLRMRVFVYLHTSAYVSIRELT